MINWNEIELDYKPRKEIFELIEKYPREPEMTVEQSAFLCGCLKKYKPRKVMEVGIAGGGTTAILIQSLYDMKLDCELYSIDWSERFYRDDTRQSGFLGKEALEKLSPLNLKHRFLFGKVACEWAEELQIHDIDCLILDTMHVMPGEVLDFITLLPYLKNGAVVILHDTSFNLLSSVKLGYATASLFSCVTANKFINCDFLNNTVYPNIAAFEVNEDTKKNVDQIFLALVITWKYALEKVQFASYSRTITKYYGKEYSDYFQLICKVQEMSVITWDRKKYRFPFGKITRDNMCIILYGAGKVGQEYMKQVSMCDRIQCVGWVDRNYDKMPMLRVDDPKIMLERDYDLIVIAIENEKVALEIIDELEGMGIERNKILWENPLA